MSGHSEWRWSSVKLSPPQGSPVRLKSSKHLSPCLNTIKHSTRRYICHQPCIIFTSVGGKKNYICKWMQNTVKQYGFLIYFNRINMLITVLNITMRLFNLSICRHCLFSIVRLLLLPSIPPLWSTGRLAFSLTPKCSHLLRLDVLGGKIVLWYWAYSQCQSF